MATTLRIELARAGFTVGGPGTTIIAQDYGDRASFPHATPTATHTITSTDPILDQKFANGYEWLGYRPIVAYDSTNVYVIVNLPYIGPGFRKIPLAPGSVGATVPHFEERFRKLKRAG